MTSPSACGSPRAGAGPATEPAGRSSAKPVLDGQRPRGHSALVYLFTIVPTLALTAAVPLAWGWGLGWADVGLAVGFYLLSGFGVTVGYHRYFTHRAFTATRPLRNACLLYTSPSPRDRS